MSRFGLIVLISFANLVTRRAVAQTGSALPWGGRGRRFKSSQPDHYPPPDSLLLAKVRELLDLFVSVRLHAHGFPNFRVLEEHGYRLNRRNDKSRKAFSVSPATYIELEKTSPGAKEDCKY